MSRAALRYLSREMKLQIKIRQPFLNTNYYQLKYFLRDLEAYLEERHAVAILGIQWDELSGHWTVLKAIESDKLRLVDSDGIKVLKRQGILVRPGHKKYLCPEETTIFELVGIAGRSVV
jgi:hypothetical protein